MKTILAVMVVLFGAQAVSVWLPEIYLHAYYALLVVSAMYAGLVVSKGREHVVVASILFCSYVFENNPSLWHDNVGVLALSHAILATAIAVLCSERFTLYFVGIYASKAMAGVGLTLGLIETAYYYHVAINVLSVLGLVWFTFLARDRGEGVRMGKYRDEITPSLRTVHKWMMSHRGLPYSKTR